MKKLLFSIGCTLLFTNAIMLFTQSCSKRDETKNSLSEKDTMFIASKYLILSNDQYKLNLSEEKALQSGITKDYYKMIDDILDVNLTIENAKKNPGIFISLTDPNEIHYKSIILKNNSETLTGSYTATPSASSTSVDIPSNTYKLKYNTGTLYSLIITVTLRTGETGGRNDNQCIYTTVYPHSSNAEIALIKYSNYYGAEIYGNTSSSVASVLFMQSGDERINIL